MIKDFKLQQNVMSCSY